MNNTLLNHDHNLKLYAVLLGCTPKGRNIEQHDMFFGVAATLEDLHQDIKTFWHKTMLDEVTYTVKKALPGLDTAALRHELSKNFTRRDKVHIDAWTELNYADGYKISILPKSSGITPSELKLYFINLGGYKENEFEEFHKKLFVVANKVTEALEKVRAHSFMHEYSPERLGKSAVAHFDDNHKIDFEADDIVCLSETIGNNYILVLEPAAAHAPGAAAVGYIPLNYTE